MRIPKFEGLSEEMEKQALAAVTKIEAINIATAATKTLKTKIKMINDIKAGKASLGYISLTQEISAMHDLVEGFEFSCYMLAEFKQKYNIV